ncbi:hypothetical protein BDV98DRAFT_89997 [Pterulicium gracile]|uniref:C2H2-type domain-containing protein n=1 Tax=Pterulicium gracile TaxID=1884261 RepID=A0A5C3QRX8_9AGAR|nr:hypothetical protein BDV98DRAFT_89997 [Pterula gracilis]
MTSGPRQSSGSHKRKASSADAASRKKPGRSGDEHRRRDRRSSLKTCPDCCQEISYSNFARHMREKHSAGHPVEEAPNGQRAGANHPQPPFDCPGCENSYTRRCSLRRHQTKTGHSESSPTSSERTLEIPTDVRSPSFDSDTDVGSPEYSRKLRLEDFFESRTAFNESFTPAFTHTEMEHQQHCGFQETDGYGTTYPQYTSSALWGKFLLALKHVFGIMHSYTRGLRHT